MDKREIKFRCWNPDQETMIDAPFMFQEAQPHDNVETPYTYYEEWRDWEDGIKRPCYVMQYTGLKDKNGVEIYEGDVLEFSDKWEWYKTKYGIKMMFADPIRKIELQKQYDNEPMERRTVEIPSDYEWLLSGEIQRYWQVIGNIFQPQ